MVSPERVVAAIDRLNLVDPADEYAYEKAFLAFLSIRSLPALVFTFERGLELFRTRTHDDDILFSEFSDILNPAPSLVKHFARCNRPYQSKFYCSENRPTSYIELVSYWSAAKELGESLYTTIGHWLFTTPVRVLIVISPDEEGRVSDFHRMHGIGYDQVIRGYDPGTIEACRIFYNYMYSKFSQPASDDPQLYIITSAYCNSVMAPNDAEIDAVCYPSVPYEQQGINFAFDSKFINQDNLQLLGALRNQFEVSVTFDGNKLFRQTHEIQAIGVDEPNQQLLWPAI